LSPVGDEPLSIAEVNQVLQVQIRNRAFRRNGGHLCAARDCQMVTENVGV
jgi:hypothetical protein